MTAARSAATAVAVVVAIVEPATSAHADRREASLHAELVGGALTTGDVDGADATDTVPLAGLAVRASYATRDSFQYDVALALLRAGEATFPSHTFMPVGAPPAIGPYRAGTTLTRLDAGVTLRLGVRWIPTARFAAGVQLRRVGPVTVDAMPVIDDARPAQLALDLVGSATIGLDHRINRRLIVGLAAGSSIAVPLGGAAARTVELTVHGAYYWYPRW